AHRRPGVADPRGRPRARAARHALQRGEDVLIRLGRIAYANMAPAFYDLGGIEVEQVTGVPTQLTRMLIDGDIDVAPISPIEYARNSTRLTLLPRLCVSSEGAVDSIQLITRKPLEHVRSVAVKTESGASVGVITA